KNWAKWSEADGSRAVRAGDARESRNSAPLGSRSRQRSRTRYSSTPAGPHAATDRRNWRRHTRRSLGVPLHSRGPLLGTIAAVFALVETSRILFWATQGGR